MFYRFIQFSVFIHVTSITNVDGSKYGFRLIPWNSMRVMIKHSVIDYEQQTGSYNKLIIDLIITHFVDTVKLLAPVPPSSDLFEVLREAEVIIEEIGSYKVRDCPKTKNFRGYEFRCLAMSRKIIILGKPSGTAIEVHARGNLKTWQKIMMLKVILEHIYWNEAQVENFVGCFKLLSSFEILNKKEHISIFDCTNACRNTTSYVGFSLDGSCYCIVSTTDFISIDLSSCGGCTESELHLCGRKNTYFGLYKTIDTMANHLQNPPSYDCLDDRSKCASCPVSRKGYNCELRDCSVNNGGCPDECLEISLSDELSYICRCANGLTGDDSHCEDFDECKHPYTCEKDQICNNIRGSFSCGCRNGYEMRSGICEDVDECLKGMCEMQSTFCLNTRGSFDCMCLEGFRTSISTLSCEDIDECLTETCPGDFACKNSPGSFECTCKVGYVKDKNGICQDVDECGGIDQCDTSSTLCRNTYGSYSCMCRIGFQTSDSPTSCDDVDECTKENPCDITSTKCNNSVGSYGCSCLSGFQKSDSATSCDDIDECKDLQRCDQNTTRCHNTIATYKCSCLEGYIKVDRFQCADEDECEPGKAKCPEGVKCINSVGSYNCLCPKGTIIFNYHSFFDCEDIDECAAINKCDFTTSFCLNTHPFYICICRKGYVTMDNFTCKLDSIKRSDESTTLTTTHRVEEQHGSYYGTYVLFAISTFVLLLIIMTGLVYVLIMRLTRIQSTISSGETFETMSNL